MRILRLRCKARYVLSFIFFAGVHTAFGILCSGGQSVTTIKAKIASVHCCHAHVESDQGHRDNYYRAPLCCARCWPLTVASLPS